MRILCCGDRNWSDEDMISFAFNHYHNCTEIIEGECDGADKLCRKEAEKRGIKVIPVPAKWDLYGLAAGPIRNSEMLKYNPDLVLAFHDDLDNSKGTKDMVTKAQRAGIKVVMVFHEES